MRGTQCRIDTMKVAGYHKPTKRKMFLMFLRKLIGIQSPSITVISKYKYEYDYFKAKYFGGK